MVTGGAIYLGFIKNNLRPIALSNLASCRQGAGGFKMTTTKISSSTTKSQTVAGGDTLEVDSTGSVTTSGVSVTFTGAAGLTTTLINSGTIFATGNRALYAKGLANGSNIVVTNNAGGKILDSTSASNNDTFKVNTDFSGGSVTINNSGYMIAGTLDSNNNIVLGSGITATGQALDLDDISSSLVTINNYAGGVIGAANEDAIRPGGNAIINNYGTIIGQRPSGTTTKADGIDFQDHIGSATINNYAGGSIIGARHGITGIMALTVDNAGTITGQLGSGINLDNAVDDNGVMLSTVSNTTITNEATGVIQGTGGTAADGSAADGDGVDVDYTVSLKNYGHIYSYGAAVGSGDKAGSVQEAVTVGGGEIYNYAGGVIQSVQRAITVDNSSVQGAYKATTIYNEGEIRGVDSTDDNFIGGISITGTFDDTVTNKGLIQGSVALGGGNDTFNAYTGSTMTGTVDGGEGTDSFNLEGTGTGSLSGILNFEALNVESGTWTVTGINGSTVITVDAGSTLELKGPNTYSGTVLKTGTLEVLDSSAAGKGGIQFADGAASTLVVGSGVTLSNTIAGFSDNDTIDFAGFDAATTKISFDNATNILSVADGLGHSQSLQFSGDYTDYEFLAAASSDGIAVSETYVACYGLGTLIETAAGDVTVESLAIGDLVRTMSGTLRPIKWIGTRSYAGRFITMNRDVLPVVFKAGSLGENSVGEAMPRRDLLISPHHAMYIDGLLIEAKDLINGVSIVQASSVERVDYFHIELESHDVIVAEGAFSETFIDDDSRAMFHNAMEYRALYPGEAPTEPLYCAPRVDEGEALEAIRAKLDVLFNISKVA